MCISYMHYVGGVGVRLFLLFEAKSHYVVQAGLVFGVAVFLFFFFKIYLFYLMNVSIFPAGMHVHYICARCPQGVSEKGDNWNYGLL